jgi:hypothetical protein
MSCASCLEALKSPQDRAPAVVKAKSGETRKGTLHRPKKWLLGGETAKHNGSSSIPSPTGDWLCLQLEVGEGLAAGFV